MNTFQFLITVKTDYEPEMEDHMCLEEGFEETVKAVFSDAEVTITTRLPID